LLKTPFSPKVINKKLAEKKIIGGLDVTRFDEEEGLLICVTEKRTKDEMDTLVEALEVLSNE
jgi:glycine dehydrogenase subunit 1